MERVSNEEECAMSSLIRRFSAWKNGLKQGATMVEYALMVALIAVALIGIVTVMSGKIGGTFTKIGAKMP